MKKTVKLLALSVFCASLTHPSAAQLKLPVASSIGSDIRKVIEDYPNRFANILGELIIENVQTADYQCRCSVTDAEEISITRYSSDKNNVYSWQALMLTTDDFEKAKQKFKSLYRQLNQLQGKAGQYHYYQLKGKYEAPSESSKFTSVLFNMENAEGHFRQLKTELVMQFHAPMEWKVSILIYDRTREDNERGSMID